jgi:hypothetical protein
MSSFIIHQIIGRRWQKETNYFSIISIPVFHPKMSAGAEKGTKKSIFAGAEVTRL